MNHKFLSQKKNLPFRVDRFPFFYGWLILLAGTIGILMSIPGQTVGVSVFTDYLIEALDMERTSLSLAYLLGTLASGLVITRAGKLYDRYGARVMAMVSGFMLGFMLFSLAHIDRLLDQFFQFFPLVGVRIFTIVFLVIGFFGIRFFGQGILTMVSRNMVMKWFQKRRGLANGIMGVFVSFGFSYSPRLLNDLIEMMNWRQVWIVLGLIIGIIFVVFAFLLFRDNPEACGCLPDGLRTDPSKKNEKDLPKQKDYTLKEATRTYRFWVFNLNLALNALFVTAITFHIVSIFGEAGMDRDTAVSIFLPASVIAVTFNFFFGWLSDYIPLKYLLLLNQLGIIISAYALITLGSSTVPYYLLIIGNGIGSGMFSVLSSVTWPRFFGTRHLGAISGYSMSWIVIGSAIGPYLYSLSLKFSGSYSVGAIVCLAMAFSIFILGFKADNIVEKNE